MSEQDPTVPQQPVIAPQREAPSGRRSYFFSCLIVALLFVGGCIAYKAIPSSIGSANPSDYDPVTLEPKAPEGILKRLGHFVFHKEQVLAGEKKDRINILLLGQGGLGHDGPYLTDTIIIVSIKPSTGEVAMISIPRDLGVNIPDYGWYKINHANAYGETQQSNWGAAFATQVIEDTFDIDIQYYVRVDFKAFEDIIDEVGGVTVTVDRTFTDPLYPAQNDDYQTVTFRAGEQSLNGSQALIYARSRHGNNGEGSDFARAARQQKVILALKEKVLSFQTLTNPVRINGVMTALDKHVTTNMSFSDIIEFIKLVRELDTDNIRRVVFDDSPDNFLQNGYSPDGAFILEPKSGSFDEMNTLIDTIFDGETTFTATDDTPDQTQPVYSDAVIEVQNGTWRAGMASRLKQRLEGEGLFVGTIGNTEERPQERSGIYPISDTAPVDVLGGLTDILHMQVKQELPADFTAATGTDILVILGEDFNE